MARKVKFNKKIFIYEYSVPNNYNYIPGRRKARRKARRLRRMERYAKSNFLLFKDEYLHYSKKECRHIRGDYINFICKELGFINKGTFLSIVY